MSGAAGSYQNHGWTQIDTDSTDGFRRQQMTLDEKFNDGRALVQNCFPDSFLSVFIRVHPWLNLPQGADVPSPALHPGPKSLGRYRQDN